MTAVIRIFYLYSSLLNVADEAHSHRRRREEVENGGIFFSVLPHFGLQQHI
jgi:hypothetical protein